MSQIKLLHSGGNGAILSSPAANPSSDVTLKLPSTTGSAGQVLKVASANHSSTNAELEFAADVGGKLLQAVTATTSTEHTNSGTTWADTGLTANITPSATSSKILILLSCTFHVESSQADAGGNIRLVRDSTTIDNSDNQRAAYLYVNNAGSLQLNMVYSQHILDSPSTTSQITYKTQSRMHYGTHVIKTQSGSKPSYITLIEVGA